MSRTKIWLVALVASCAFAVASPALAVKPVTPNKVKDKGKKAAPKSPASKARPASPASEATPATGAAKTPRKAAPPVLPRPIKKTELPTRKEPNGEVRIVITNDSLTQRYGRSDAKPRSPDYTPFLGELDKQAKKEARKERRASRRQADKQAQINKIQADLDRLKKKLLGLRNPYLPRGKSTKKETAAQKGMDNVQRVKVTKEEIARLEQELLKLQR